MKYKLVVFGVKTSTISLMETFKEDIDLIVTIGDTTRQNNHIAEEGDFSEFAKINNIECYSTEDYSLKSDVDFFENNEFELGISYGWQRLIPQYILDRFIFAR